jgi:hypothetical protein
MPTAAKLIAAVAFAAVAWLAAAAYIPLLPEGTRTGFFKEIMAALGFLIGWRTVGAHLRTGYAEAASLGLRASLFIVAWALFGFSVYVMIQRSTKMIYHDAGEAVLDVPMQMIKYGKLLADAKLVEVLIAGGLIGGLVTEFVGRRWS